MNAKVGTEQQLTEKLAELRQRVAELEAAEAGRKSVEELLKAIAERLPISVYIVQEGKFKYVNPQLVKAMGYSEAEILNTKSLSYVFPGDRDAFRLSSILMLREKLPYPYEYRIMNKAGEIRWVMETATPIQYQGKQATLGNFMDITERKVLEKRITEYEELDKLKSDLLSTVSHELRVPLATIKGYSTMTQCVARMPSLSMRPHRQSSSW